MRWRDMKIKKKKKKVQGWNISGTFTTSNNICTEKYRAEKSDGLEQVHISQSFEECDKTVKFL